MALVRRQFLRVAAAAAAAPLISTAAVSQPYPTRSIKVLVPVAPGGPVDVITRLITQKLGTTWRSQLHVENMPTGAGNAAMSMLANASPDGYTVGAVTTALVINPSLYTHARYNPVKDFAPITLIGSSPHVLVIHPAVPAANVSELIALARAETGKYSYASPGTGQSGQLAGEMFRLATGLDLAHIPFNGAVPAITSTVAGHTPMAFMSLAAAAASIRDGKLRALAVTSSSRSDFFPEIPTMTEAGIANQESAFWQGLVFPAATPADLVQRWHRDIIETVALEEVRARLLAMSLDVVANTPEQFAARIKADFATWRAIIERARVRTSD